jgi:hypothetical protein
MAKTKKKKGGFLRRLIVFVLVLIVVVYAAAKILFPAERVRAEIVSRATQALGRPVELDKVSLSVFPRPSVKLTGLRIFNQEGFPGPQLAAVDDLSLRLKILPLLRKQFVFSEISVSHPVFHLRKRADGSTNYSFDVKTEEAGVPVPSTEERRETVKSEEAALSVFAFDWAEIRGADIVYVDDSAQMRFTLSSVSLQARLILDESGNTAKSSGKLEISRLEGTPIPTEMPLTLNLAYNAELDFQHADVSISDATLTVNGIPFTIEATVRNFTSPNSVFARIKADHVAIEPLAAYLPDTETFDIDKYRLHGYLSGELETRFEFASDRPPYLAGSFVFDSLTAGYQTLSNRIFAEKLDVQFDSDTLSFATSNAQLSEKPLMIRGKIKEFDDPVFQIRTRGSYQLTGLLPFMDVAKNHDLKGSISFDLELRGKKSKWMDMGIAGQLVASDVYYTNADLTNPLQDLDMALSFEEDRVSVDSLHVQYPGAVLNLTGTLANGFAHLLDPKAGHKKPFLRFDLDSPVIDYDILAPPEEEMAGRTDTLPAPIILPDIDAAGAVTVDSLVFRDLAFTNISANVRYHDGIITYENAKGDMYGGKVQADGSVDINDMTNPVVTSSFTGTAVEVDRFMDQFLHLGGYLFGKINTEGKFTGTGSEPDQFVRSLSMTADVSMKEGKLVNLPIVTKIAQNFGITASKEEQLRDLVTTLKVDKGRLVLEKTNLATSNGDWSIGGGIGFIEKKLDLDINLYASPAITKQIGDVGNFLADSQGRFNISFDLVGPYTDGLPSPTNISIGSKEKTQDKVKDAAKGLLDQLFKKKDK